MEIEFDTEKAVANIQNHGISFEEAKQVLLDPYVLTQEDLDIKALFPLELVQKIVF